MWPKWLHWRIMAVTTVAYGCLWALYLLVPDIKNALLDVPYIGRAIELLTGLYVAVVITWIAFQLVFRG